MSEPVISLARVGKEYRSDGVVAPVLFDIDLVIEPGEFVALVGPSGSGKSTLLNLLGLLDRPTTGKLWVTGHEVGDADDETRTRIRGEQIGFVFQFHHLIRAFSAAENLVLPMAIGTGRVSRKMRDHAVAALDRVGLGDRADSPPGRLSGGQQQRVAVARALMRRPAIVLADEPTGNLDTQSAAGVFALLREVNREDGTAFLIVTHDRSLAAQCDRRVTLVDGRIVSDERGAAQ
jgi:lipoprotein-releasing system ATP-binding protein